MKKITVKEEEIMNFFWDKGELFVKQILESYPEPKPHYNTISTMVRILIEKGFIGFHQYGNNREYFPLVARKDYLKGQFRGVLKSYFQGSFSKFASFYSDEENISLEELEEIRMLIQEEINSRKNTKNG